jgi:hypothetical protein
MVELYELSLMCMVKKLTSIHLGVRAAAQTTLGTETGRLSVYTPTRRNEVLERARILNLRGITFGRVDSSRDDME